LTLVPSESLGVVGETKKLKSMHRTSMVENPGQRVERLHLHLLHGAEPKIRMVWLDETYIYLGDFSL